MYKTIIKHYNKAIALIIVLILIIFIIFINTINKIEAINYEKIQILLNNENITSNLKDDIIIQDDNKIYMSIEDIKQHIDKTIYEEEETGTIITTSEKKLAVMSEENTEYITINGSKQLIKNY